MGKMVTLHSQFSVLVSVDPKTMCSFHSLVLGPELLGCNNFFFLLGCNNVYDTLTTFNLSANETETTKIWAKDTFRHPPPHYLSTQ